MRKPMRREAYLKAWSAWAPGVESAPQWAEWAVGGRSIQRSEAAPPLGHLPSLFKRRLSQVSRMVLHVGHELGPGPKEIKTVFASEYGEICQQIKLSTSLVESGEIGPSAFSLSVFNTPVALLSMAEKNTDRVVALHAGPASFETALWEAIACLEHHGDSEIMMIAADEMVPAPFDELASPRSVPYALGLLLSRGREAETVQLGLEMDFDSGGAAEESLSPSALRFLCWFLGERLEPLALGQPEYTLRVR
jgi:hypothetical protein